MRPYAAYKRSIPTQAHVAGALRDKSTINVARLANVDGDPVRIPSIVLQRQNQADSLPDFSNYSRIYNSVSNRYS